MRQVRVLVAGHDMGGINLLLALMRGWRGDADLRAELLCPPVLRRDIGHQSPDLTFAPAAEDLTENMFHRRLELDRYLDDLLARGRYDAVICGTSAHALLERRLLLAARKAGLPSVAFCDMWWAYAERFHDGETWTLPDRLWVIDEAMAEAAALVAWPRSLPIDTVGSPLFGELARKRGQSQNRGNAIRFISEPVSTKFPDVGIDEFALADMLVSVVQESGLNLPVVIRPHPVDSLESWRRWIYARRHLGVRLDDLPIEAAIPDTLRAVGISSILLTEMRMCGVAVASLQPRDADLSYYCLPFDTLGIARIGGAPKLAAWLSHAFDGDGAAPEAASLHLDSVAAAKRLIVDIVSNRRSTA